MVKFRFILIALTMCFFAQASRDDSSSLDQSFHTLNLLLSGKWKWQTIDHFTLNKQRNLTKIIRCTTNYQDNGKADFDCTVKISLSAENKQVTIAFYTIGGDELWQLSSNEAYLRLDIVRLEIHKDEQIAEKAKSQYPDLQEYLSAYHKELHEKLFQGKHSVSKVLNIQSNKITTQCNGLATEHMRVKTSSIVI